jgi:hypothetical protein
MSSMKIVLSSSLLALFVAGCNHGSTSGSGTSTAGASRSHGDLVPTALVRMPVAAPQAGEALSASDALVPRDTFNPDAMPMVFSTRGLQRVMQGGDSFTFPVDQPLGARVLVRPLDPKFVMTSVHMHSVATGLTLDHGRDSQNTALGTKSGMVSDTQREPSFAPLVNTRTLSFDEPMEPGLVQLDLPADLRAVGVVVEVQEPNTRIQMSGQSDELAYAYGDRATLTFNLASDATPIEGATVSATMELADHSRTPEMNLVPNGHGQYVATLPLNYTDAKYVGAWGVHVRATGSFQGVPFERTVEAGFGYWPAHAHMTTVGTPVAIRGGDGLIDEVSVAVGVETLSDDQFSVRGLLTYTGTDGVEHPIATAQTGQVVTQQQGGTITLHFGAPSLAYSKISGPFHVRDLALVSQGNGTTQHRIGRGLGLDTPAFTFTEVRVPMTAPLHVQELIANGDLEAPATK